MRKIFFALILISLNSCQERKPTINIAVASNFEQTLKKILEKYPDKEYQINVISASSGVLANQIANNAPFDLFLSADVEKAEYIYKQNKTLKPRIYAIGRLALWIPSMDNSGKCINNLPKVKTVVIANPKTAPYGSVAQAIIEKHNIKIDKLIQAANISQSYLYTKDKLAQAGFVAYSMLKNDMSSVEGCIQTFDNRALSQAMILLNDKAKDFYSFILSEPIQTLIENSGYHINTSNEE